MILPSEKKLIRNTMTMIAGHQKRSIVLMMLLTLSTWVMVLQSRAHILGTWTSRDCNNLHQEAKFTTEATTINRKTVKHVEYIPATVESYVVENAVQLGYESNTSAREYAPGCQIWLDPNATSPTIYRQLNEYRTDLDQYSESVKNFTAQYSDLRLRLDDAEDVCKTVDLLDNGGRRLFQRSQQLSLTSAGFVEPLLPPMRHPSFCEKGRRRLYDLNYIVHDFGEMCRQLKRESRVILVDMGASLRFAGTESPAIYLIDKYHKFGFPFDHIYAYEITPTQPKDVFEQVPPYLLPAYHWINVGVNTEPGHPLNPFTMLKEKYNKDDLIVVKLDIDTPMLEFPLVQQLLHDDELADLVDQFYFEHHVHLEELRPYWGQKVNGTVKDSLDIFHELRKKGVAAHFWV